MVRTAGDHWGAWTAYLRPGADHRYPPEKDLTLQVRSDDVARTNRFCSCLAATMLTCGRPASKVDRTGRAELLTHRHRREQRRCPPDE